MNQAAVRYWNKRDLEAIQKYEARRADKPYSVLVSKDADDVYSYKTAEGIVKRIDTITEAYLEIYVDEQVANRATKDLEWRHRPILQCFIDSTGALYQCVQGPAILEENNAILYQWVFKRPVAKNLKLYRSRR